MSFWWIIIIAVVVLALTRPMKESKRIIANSVAVWPYKKATRLLGRKLVEAARESRESIDPARQEAAGTRAYFISAVATIIDQAFRNPRKVALPPIESSLDETLEMMIAELEEDTRACGANSCLGRDP